MAEIWSRKALGSVVLTRMLTDHALLDSPEGHAAIGGLEGYGGAVARIPILEGFSATSTMRRIRI